MPDHPAGWVTEPIRRTPVALECDLCVVGGSCTGVFAAVRAARLGLSVALVEANAIFGGMAAAAQVNEWHSIHDAFFEKEIIGGLTIEVVESLRARGALHDLPPGGRIRFRFNSAEMALELDRLVQSHGIRPFLAARCVAAVAEGDDAHRRLSHAVIEDRSGRRAIRAACFVDASGDGSLLRAAGFAARKNPVLQPVTLQALVERFARPRGYWERIRPFAAKHGYPLDNSVPWVLDCPGAESVMNVFGPRLHGCDASDADQYTQALMEGRRLHHALLEMTAEGCGVRPGLVAWPHALGVRETWHAVCDHQLDARDLLNGKYFPDTIGAGTYPVDIHRPDGTLLRHLDGREEFVGRDGAVESRIWRARDETPSAYFIPLSALRPRGSVNLLVAGRLIDADPEAFSAVRVMVNMNQTGEAAGVAAWIACERNLPLSEVPAQVLRRHLIQGGSADVEPPASPESVKKPAAKPPLPLCSHPRSTVAHVP